MSPSDPGRAESVRQRLRNRLHERGEDVQFGLQRYAVERFLYRLGESRHRDRFILKGAALFALWGGSLYRATRDLDFTGYGSPDQVEVLADLREVCAQPDSGDELTFDGATLTAEPIRDDSEYDGLRVRLEGRLGTSRIPVRIDIGFGNAIDPPPHAVTYPTLLDDPPPRIQAYPLEAVISEKFHAMVALGERNSRYKDFYDIHALARQFPFDGARLARSIAATFERRRTVVDAAMPAALGPRFFADPAKALQWRTYIHRNRLPGAPADFDAVGETLRTFLGPVWHALAGNEALPSSWNPGGPWTAVLSPTVSVPPTSREVAFANRRSHLTAAEAGVTATPSGGHRERSALRFKPYPAYKASGVEWLGEIPAHWDVKRLKHLAALNPEALLEDTDPAFEMAYVDIGGVDSLGHIIEHEHLVFAVAPSRARRLVRNGDVIVSTVRTYLRAIAPVRDPEPGMVVSTGFAVVRPDDELTTDYAAYALRAPHFVERVVANSKGVSFPAINESEMATYELATPPKPEQHAIAAFLDRETARIDALVARKERLNELLQEKRTALITRAVTKGLDPTVPMKDSGVEWLGEIPAHWDAERIKWVARMESGHTPDKKVESYWHGGNIPWVSLADTGQLREVDYVESTAVMTTADGIAHSSAHVLPPGTVVFSRDATIGLCAITRAGMAVSQHFIGWVCSSRLQPEYLLLVLRSMTQELERLTMGATVRTIGMPDVKSLVTPIPPRPEQEEIVRMVLSRRAYLDALIGKVRDAIDRLKELRTALISAAVTGKIDVREEVP